MNSVVRLLAVLAIVLCGTGQGSDKSPSAKSYLAPVTLDYDGPMPHVPLPWLFQCGHTVVGFDFGTGEIISFIQLLSGSGGVSGRYLAGLRVEPTEFFGDLFQYEELGDTRSAKLAKVIARLSRVTTPFGQLRHIDGTVRISPRGEMKRFPGNPRAARPPHVYGAATLYNCDTTGFPIYGGDEFRRFQDPGELYQGLKQTLAILKAGQQNLEQASGEESREAFRRQIADNAGTIAAEFAGVFQLLRTKSFHLVEVGYFLNQLREMVMAIDALLMDELGTEPGLVSRINAQRGTP